MIRLYAQGTELVTCRPHESGADRLVDVYRDVPGSAGSAITLGAAGCRAQQPTTLELAPRGRRHLRNALRGLLHGLERLLERGQRVDGDVDNAGKRQVRNDVAQLFR